MKSSSCTDLNAFKVRPRTLSCVLQVKYFYLLTLKTREEINRLVNIFFVNFRMKSIAVRVVKDSTLKSCVIKQNIFRCTLSCDLPLRYIFPM